MNVPIYISEIVPNEMRGTFVSMYTLLVVIGQLVANVMALVFGHRFVVIVWLGEILCALQIVGVIFALPESPRWLAQRGMTEMANKCLDKIYKQEYVEIYKRSL